MRTLTAAEIGRRSGGTVEGDAGTVVDSWAFDSRALAPGACFVALRDSRDGHDFVGAAFDAGAHVAVVDRPVAAGLASGRALVHTADTLAALQTVARTVRAERSEVHVVAVWCEVALGQHVSRWRTSGCQKLVEDAWPYQLSEKHTRYLPPTGIMPTPSRQPAITWSSENSAGWPRR